jgi:hypothetical protein
MSHNGSADSVLSVQAPVMEGVCRQHCVCEYKGDSFFSHMFFPRQRCIAAQEWSHDAG